MRIEFGQRQDTGQLVFLRVDNQGYGPAQTDLAIIHILQYVVAQLERIENKTKFIQTPEVE